MLLQTKIGYYSDTTSRSNIYPFHVHFQEKYGLAPFFEKIILIYTGSYLKIGMEHGARGALAEQGVQAGGIANGYVPACRTPLCQRIPLEQGAFRVCHAQANFEIGSSGQITADMLKMNVFKQEPDKKEENMRSIKSKYMISGTIGLLLAVVALSGKVYADSIPVPVAEPMAGIELSAPAESLGIVSAASKGNYENYAYYYNLYAQYYSYYQSSGSSLYLAYAYVYYGYAYYYYLMYYYGDAYLANCYYDYYMAYAYYYYFAYYGYYNYANSYYNYYMAYTWYYYACYIYYYYMSYGNSSLANYYYNYYMEYAYYYYYRV